VSPRTVLNVSATAYAFAVELQEALGVPVGVIQVTAPFSTIAPWIPDQALRNESRLGHVVARTDSLVAAHRAALPDHLASLEAWLGDVEAAVAAGADVPATPAVPVHPLATGTEAGSLFAGMVSPLTPLAVAGVLWHQGERDLGKGASYAVLQEALVKGWRAAWRRPQLPWLSVQLPPYRYGGHRPTEKPESEVDPLRLPELWESQARLLELPHTGLVGTSDLGELDEMFFPERRILGRRLSHWALARCYDKPRVYWGPTFASAENGGPLGAPLGDILGGELAELTTVRVELHGAAGLSTRDGGRPDWWELSSDGEHFVMAQARLDGQSVRVWSADVPRPLVVRYGWHQEARGNLVNGAGLPAMPFRASVR
jgi:sialate O-acetylesterase